MQKVLTFLSGKKTFITGALMVALGVLQNDTQMILNGLGLIFLRAAVNKV